MTTVNEINLENLLNRPVNMVKATCFVNANKRLVSCRLKYKLSEKI